MINIFNLLDSGKLLDAKAPVIQVESDWLVGWLAFLASWSI